MQAAGAGIRSWSKAAVRQQALVVERFMQEGDFLKACLHEAVKGVQDRAEARCRPEALRNAGEAARRRGVGEAARLPWRSRPWAERWPPRSKPVPPRTCWWRCAPCWRIWQAQQAANGMQKWCQPHLWQRQQGRRGLALGLRAPFARSVPLLVCVWGCGHPLLHRGPPLPSGVLLWEQPERALGQGWARLAAP